MPSPDPLFGSILFALVFQKFTMICLKFSLSICGATSLWKLISFGLVWFGLGNYSHITVFTHLFVLIISVLSNTSCGAQFLYIFAPISISRPLLLVSRRILQLYH